MPPKPTPKPTEPIEPFVPNEDRRIAPRLKPHEVPWIREVKPISGDTARLLNISKTGLLLETTARLQPGRRSTVVIAVDGSERKERAEGHVIRTELVSIGAGGELIRSFAAGEIRLLKAPPAVFAEDGQEKQTQHGNSGISTDVEDVHVAASSRLSSTLRTTPCARHIAA